MEPPRARPPPSWAESEDSIDFKESNLNQKQTPPIKLLCPLNLRCAPRPSWHPEEPPTDAMTLPGQARGCNWATPAPSLHFWMNRVR